MRALLRLKRRLGRFGRAEGGAAAVEFAMVLPIMLLLYIGSIEVTLLISMDRKLQSVTGALGDLVARSDTTILVSTLEDYFTAASGIMTPHASATLQQTVTQVAVADNGSATVVWSRDFHDGAISPTTRYSAGDSFDLPDAMTDIARGDYVIVAEGSYSYAPIYGYAFQQTVDLHRENFFMPRFGDRIDIVED